MTIKDTEEYKFGYQLMNNNISGVPAVFYLGGRDISVIDWLCTFLPLFKKAIDEEEYEIAQGFKDAYKDFFIKHGVEIPEDFKLKTKIP